ncbi:MAG: hypothetical protein LBD82_08540 [Deltaproteobacteria bacterium]|jgi:hypothetical protein|nr:hypothetical protein [Deltaproteobacteria bacterium]
MQAVSEAKKVKFATQADPKILAELRKIAGQEGRQLQALIDEALREYLARKQGNVPRRRVMLALHDSVTEYDSLYRELAK